MYFCRKFKAMDTLFKKHNMLISQVPMTMVRGMMNQIKWDRQLVGIKGSRGVGKTTLIRQYIKDKYGVQPGKALYCVMDSLYFSSHSLLELAEKFHLMGGEHLFLDEVHKYPTWSKEIKEIYDLYPDLKVTFSGSSLLQILNADADLSRRALSYTMPGLSFREFLHFYKGIDIPTYDLSEILEDPHYICQQVNAQCRPQILFEEYLKVGYYPFYNGDIDEYYSRIENIITYIIEQEMTQFCNIEVSYTRKIKALLIFLAQNVPFDVNIAKLTKYLEINKNTVLHYLISMQKAELIKLLYSDNISISKMQKPDKIYLQNPNLMYAISQSAHLGTIRECFVANQLSYKHEIEYGKSAGDFKVDGKTAFEVGGEHKKSTQITQLKDAYVLADSIEFPIGNKLPLWVMGFLY